MNFALTPTLSQRERGLKIFLIASPPEADRKDMFLVGRKKLNLSVTLEMTRDQIPPLRSE